MHVTARSWADPAVREPILELARRGLINAVQLDVKDESGEVGYASTVPLAISTGAARGHYDAVTALDELHALGVRVIGRIVCFLDPVVATWAWENDRSDMIVLQGSGGPLATDYGTAAFTNLASAEVRQYLIDLAVEAAELGFDEILYDYVRRPEGDTSAMYFPGLQIAPDVVVARFVADSNAQLSRTDALLGVSVFGIAATRPDQIAQDIRLLAPHVDYVAPMVYPSHWGAGEYDVADPLRQPGAIVLASVGDFAHVVAGSGAAVVPWLQDFSAGGVAVRPGRSPRPDRRRPRRRGQRVPAVELRGVLHRRGLAATAADRWSFLALSGSGTLPVLGDVEVDRRSVAAGVVDLQGDGQRLVGDELLVGADDGGPSLVAR